MAKVRHLYGKTKSVSGSSVKIEAEEDNIFFISADLNIKDIKENTLEWILMDKTKKVEVFKAPPAGWDGKFIVQFDKKTSGSYSYFLKASYIEKKTDKPKTISGINLSGYCDPNILNFSWKSDGDEGENTLRAGDALTLSFEVEGLNGDKVTLEIYRKEKDGKLSKVETQQKECIEDKVSFFAKGTSTFTWLSIDPLKGSVEGTLVVKLKNNTTKKYVEFNSNEVIEELKITQKNIKPSQSTAPANTTVSTVNTPSTKTPEVNGILSLIKLKVSDSTTGGIVVTNDHILTQGDANELWILPDGGVNYHWLKNRTDNKPEVMPVAYPSSNKFKLEATFTCLSDFAETVYLKAVDLNGFFKFNPQQLPALTRGDTPAPIVFEDTMDAKKILYFPRKEFAFYYSFDQKIWIPLGLIPLELYATRGLSRHLYTDLQESLLYLSCKPCHNKKNTISDEELLDTIFKQFKSRTVMRRRENKDNDRPRGGVFLPTAHRFPDKPNKGMGYWRGISTFTNDFTTIPEGRGNTYWEWSTLLLRRGEARCGEWTELLKYLLQVQGCGSGLSDEAICTSAMVDGLHMQYNQLDPSGSTVAYRPGFSSATVYRDPITGRPTGTDGNALTGDSYSETFAVKKAKHNSTTNERSTTGKSPGQGTSEAQPFFWDHIWFYHTTTGRFYDPSYGKSYSASKSKLKDYCKDNLNSIYVKMNHGTPTVRIEIKKKDIHKYIIADKGIF